MYRYRYWYRYMYHTGTGIVLILCTVILLSNNVLFYIIYVRTYILLKKQNKIWYCSRLQYYYSSLNPWCIKQYNSYVRTPEKSYVRTYVRTNNIIILILLYVCTYVPQDSSLLFNQVLVFTLHTGTTRIHLIVPFTVQPTTLTNHFQFF